MNNTKFWVRWLSGVRCRPWLAAMILVSSQIMAVACWFALPHQYKAQAMVLISLTAAPVQVVRDDATANVMAARTALLQSRLLADRVVARLGLASNNTMREAWASGGVSGLSYDDWIASVASAGLMPEVKKGSFMVSVGYVAPSASFATAFANAYAAELVIFTDLLNKGYDQFAERAMGSAVDRARAQMLDAQKQVLAESLKGSEGLADPEMRQFLKLSAITNRNNRAYLDTNAVDQTVGKLSELGSALDDKYLETQRITLLDLRSQRSSAATQFGEGHPVVKSIDANIQSIEKGIALYEGKRRQSLSASTRQSRDTLNQTEQNSDAAKQALLGNLRKSQAYDASSETAAQRGEAYEMAVADHAVLEANREASRADVVLLSKAEEPTAPYFPLWYYYFPTAGVIGLICAALGCAWIERRDRRVRSANDLTVLFGTELAGRIPKG
jgi:polysaccharide biosynthesis transport protein